MNTSNFPRRKEEKRLQAAERQAASDKLSPQQKLQALDKLGFRAERQRARIQSLINSKK
jgi:hypothetical protein